MQRWIFLILLGVFASPLSAKTISIGVDDLTRVINAATPADSAQALLVQRLNQSLDGAGLSLQSGQVLMNTTLTNLTLAEPRCAYRAALERMDVSIALRSGSRFEIDLQNLRDPVAVTAKLVADLRGERGRVEQITGVPFINNQCLGEARYGFDIAVTGTVDVDLSVLITPDVAVLPNGVLRFTPRLHLAGALTPLGYRVDVEDTLWEPVLESALTQRLDQYFRPANQAQLLAELERELYRQMDLAWGGRYVDVVLPDLTTEQVAKLYAALAGGLSFPLTQKYLEDNKLALLTALFTRDTPALQRLLSSGAACDASRLLLADMPYRPLFVRGADGRCAAADLRSGQSPGAAFADAACRTPVAYRPTPLAEYCAETIDSARLGNAAALGSDPAPWTLWPGNQFDVGLASTASLRQPYMTRLRYRSVSGVAGTCELEMRVYKPSVDAVGLNPLLALHGGSWQSRGSGMLGLEALAAHYTERGFVVFAPFYRLAGDAEGSPACHGVTGREIVADAEAALSWVRANGERFGARTGKVHVTGQSAGGHLAAWLAVQQPENVARALLLYPPSDFADFLAALRGGAIFETSVVQAVERFLGQSVASVAFGDPWAAANSFPQRIAAQPAAFPPSFIVHGVADKVVPSNQSVRLCNAYSGSPDSGPALASGGDPATGVFRAQYRCDERGSQLHLIAQGDHALDACLFGAVCPAGGDASQTAARASLVAGYDWLAGRSVSGTALTAADVNANAAGQPSKRAAATAGGGVFGWGWVAALAGAGAARLRRRSGPAPVLTGR